LDYDRIQRTAIGSIRKPNTVFQGSTNHSSGPVGRWQKALSPTQVLEMERRIGPLLRDLGYSLTTPEQGAGLSPKLMRAEYDALFQTKLWLKSRTPFGRFMQAGLIRGDTDLPASKN